MQMSLNVKCCQQNVLFNNVYMFNKCLFWVCLYFLRLTLTSKSLGWNMFWMMRTFSCLLRASMAFSGLQSSCLIIINDKCQSSCLQQHKNMLIKQSIVALCVRIDYIEPQDSAGKGLYFCCIWSFLRYSLFFFFFLLASYCPLSSNRAASTCSR